MRRAFKLFLLLIGIVAILLLLILVQSVEPHQKPPSVDVYHFPDTLSNLEISVDSLRSAVGPFKGLPNGFEKPALIALTAYPQLRDVRINMILTEGGAPMESNFDFWTLFGSGKNRVYEVLLNDARDSYFDPILLRNLPFDAQVGILAHELGHVVYYHQLSTLQIAKWGLMYLFDGDFRSIHEKTTDLMPVYHGLGNQIYQYAWYVRHAPCCKDLYQRFSSFMDAYYLTDDEILEAMGDSKFKIQESKN